jgi:uncharacterized protein YyaL (SSP411 family)
MLAGGLIRAGVALNESWALDHGLKTLTRIRGDQADPSALSHSPGGLTGLLDDQVQTALAAIEAYEATADPGWLQWSETLLDRVWADYLDGERGGLWDIAGRPDEGLLPTRARPVQDTPTPSPNGVAALAAARLAELTQAPRWGERRDALVRAFAGVAPDLGIFGATFLLALDWSLNPGTHLVIVEGQEAGHERTAAAMHRIALSRFVPRRVVQRITAGGSTELPRPVAAMAAHASHTRGYACIGASCLTPAESLEGWSAELDGLRPAESIPGN